MSKMVWTIEDVRLPEGGPFSRTQHKARLSCEYMSDVAFSPTKPWNSTEKQVREIARNAWRSFNDADNYEWPETRLISLTNITEGVWEIVIEDAYLD